MAKKTRKLKLAMYADDVIRIGATVDFGRREVGTKELTAAREALNGAEDEDSFFFACVELATNSVDEEREGDFVDKTTDSWPAAPYGFIDMVDRDRPLPAVGAVVALNASTRDAVGVAQTPDDDAVVRFEWKRGETIAFVNGRLVDYGAIVADPPAKEGTTREYVSHLVPRECSLKTNGIDDSVRYFDAGVAVVDVPVEKESEFPVAFELADADGSSFTRTYRYADGQFWVDVPVDSRSGKETVEERLRSLRKSVRPSKLATPRSERKRTLLTSEAARCGASVVTKDGNATAHVERAIAIAKAAKLYDGLVWTPAEEPRYVLLPSGAGDHMVVHVAVVSYPLSWAKDTVELPITTPVDEVFEAARSLGKLASTEEFAKRRLPEVKYADPKMVKIKSPSLSLKSAKA